jgi:hypothetical protein
MILSDTENGSGEMGVQTHDMDDLLLTTSAGVCFPSFEINNVSPKEMLSVDLNFT